jgi:vacuolar-type H+-ATPase subunit F/Vma7
MRNVIALTKGLTSLQLTLAGMRVEKIEDPRAVEERLAAAIESQEARVVIVQEEFRTQFSEWFTERMRRHKGLPLVVYCPAFEEEESDVDAYLTAVLKPAIGYEIRLE